MGGAGGGALRVLDRTAGVGGGLASCDALLSRRGRPAGLGLPVSALLAVRNLFRWLERRSGRGDGGLSIAEGEMEGGGKGVKECERWESARV